MANPPISIDFLKNLGTKSESKSESESEQETPIYKAVPYKGFGFSSDIMDGPIKLLVGLTLELVNQDKAYDLVQEEISNVGTDAAFVLPDEGLIPNQRYEARVVNETTDWETNIVEGYEIELVKTKKGIVNANAS